MVNAFIIKPLESTGYEQAMKHKFVRPAPLFSGEPTVTAVLSASKRRPP